MPLMAMIRARHESGNPAPMRLIYSARTPEDVFYATELAQRTEREDGLDGTILYSRQAPAGSPRPARRLDAAELEELAWPVAHHPLSFICGPTGFVDAAATVLARLGAPRPPDPDRAVRIAEHRPTRRRPTMTTHLDGNALAGALGRDLRCRHHRRTGVRACTAREVGSPRRSGAVHGRSGHDRAMSGLPRGRAPDGANT